MWITQSRALLYLHSRFYVTHKPRKAAAFICDLYFESSNRDSGVVFWLTWLCGEEEEEEEEEEERGLRCRLGLGGGGYCADDFSPVQTSSSAALRSPPHTLCYCSRCDDLLLKETLRHQSEVWLCVRARDMSPLFLALLSAGPEDSVQVQTKTMCHAKQCVSAKWCLFLQ